RSVCCGPSTPRGSRSRSNPMPQSRSTAAMRCSPRSRSRPGDGPTTPRGGPPVAEPSRTPLDLGTVRCMQKPLGPYTPAVRAGDFIFVSGQLGMSDGVLADGGVAGQAAQSVANLRERLAEMGADLTDVVKTTCFLIDMDAFAT